MAGYEFVTEWHVGAPLNAVWDAIYHSERWPEWWHGLESVVELEKGSDSGVGNVRRYTWRGRLPYRLSFDIRISRIDRPHFLEGIASGDLAGTGRWHFTPDDATTRVRCEWRVATTKRWMNVLAPVLSPLFRWNHDWVMVQGGRGLARHLGVNLIDHFPRGAKGKN
ncbi:MAG: polyketide cyclase [Desulfuromonadales bacterium]|nr:MAG: polyketide cyclase [Desulfuromonadales bacterium]